MGATSPTRSVAVVITLVNQIDGISSLAASAVDQQCSTPSAVALGASRSPEPSVLYSWPFLTLTSLSVVVFFFWRVGWLGWGKFIKARLHSHLADIVNKACFGEGVVWGFEFFTIASLAEIPWPCRYFSVTQLGATETGLHDIHAYFLWHALAPKTPRISCWNRCVGISRPTIPFHPVLTLLFQVRTPPLRWKLGVSDTHIDNLCSNGLWGQLSCPKHFLSPGFRLFSQSGHTLQFLLADYPCLSLVDNLSEVVSRSVAGLVARPLISISTFAWLFRTLLSRVYGRT